MTSQISSNWWICSLCGQAATTNHTCPVATTAIPFSGATVTTTTGYCLACDLKKNELAELKARVLGYQRKLAVVGAIIDSLQDVMEQLDK